MSSSPASSKKAHPLRHAIVITLEVMALVLALLVLAVLLFAGRLMLGPVATTSLTPMIEGALSQPAYGVSAKITQSLLSWDREQKKAVLDLSNIQFVDGLGQNIANIPQILMVLHPLGYFDEAHSPWSVAVRRPHLHVRVDKEGKAHLGALSSGMASAPAEEAPEKKEEQPVNMATLEAVLKDVVRSPRGRTAGLGLFANLSVEELGITVIDEAGGQTWNVRAPAMSLKRIKSDYQGKASIVIEKADMKTPLDLSLAYSSREDDFTATFSFDHLNPALFSESVPELKVLEHVAAPLTGTVMVHFDENLHVFDGALNINIDAGELRIEGLYEKPLRFMAGQAVARYDAKKKEVLIEPLRIDFDKDMALSAKANINVAEAMRQLLANFTISGLAVEKLPQYWPESAGKNARDWILPHVKGGKIEEATVNLGLTFPQHDVEQAEVTRVDGSVKVSGTQLTYWDPLPPLTKVNAEATFTDKGFDIKVLSGEVGAVKLAPSPVTITGLDEVDQIMTINAHISGPASDILAILDKPPLGYASKMGLKPKDAGGTATGILTMSFPLLKALTFEQIKLRAEADVKNASLKKIADLISVADGDGHIAVTPQELSFSAKAKLNDVPAEVEWTEKFTAVTGKPLSHGKIKATAKAEDAAKFGVALEMKSDKLFPVNVDYQRFAALSRLDVKGNVGEVALDLPDLSYTKPAGVPAQFEVALEWGGEKPMRLPNLSFTGKNISLKGQGEFDAQQSLKSISIKPLKLDATDVAVELSNKNGVPQVEVSGEVLDLRRALSGAGQDSAGKSTKKTPLLLNVNVARVLTGAEAGLDKLALKGRRDEHGWAELSLSAKGVKGTPLTLKLGPQEGRTQLLIETPDFGNILRALDVTDTLDGGKLMIDGKSEPGDYTRTLFGHIKLEGYNVRNMPALAQLISAISPDGLAAMLAGEGLKFGDLTGEYVLNNDAIVLTKASTTTGSLGLTAAGKYDLDSGKLQMEGQVIPVYFLNQILGAIPLIGDILTGGEGGGVFSATYRVDGPISKPKISVNPVSVLAPGILRTILFTDHEITKDKKEAPAPEKKE